MSIDYFYGLLLIISTFNLGKTRQLLQNNGWTPLTKEEVYAPSRSLPDRIQNIQFASIQHSKKPDVKSIEDNIATTTTHPVDVRDLHNIRNKAIKIVNPDIGQHFDYKNVNTPVEPETVKSVNELQIAYDESKEQDSENNKNITTAASSGEPLTKILQNDESNKNKRKPKAILGESSNNEINEKIFNIEKSRLNDNENNFQRRSFKDKRQDDSTVYEVTEDINENVFEDATMATDRTSGYFYTRPKLNLNLSRQNNLTNTLLNILSKHNIKPEDELPNYTLSRKTKNQDPINAFMFIPIPLKVLPQFNNLKQLSVDPLLAVLMSNYGYYFPGSYGIHSRYKNLYGHLASNNIHNNKPFGSYKIFSDTDSSN